METLTIESTTSPDLFRGPSEITDGSRNKSGKSGDVAYPIFFKNEATNTVIRQSSALSFEYVQVIGFEDGSYKHHRGRTCMPNTQRMEEALYYQELVEATADEYLSMLKNYFAVDKKVREGFMNKYGY